MNIFSWLLLSYSLNFGAILPQWGSPVIYGQEIQPFFIEYGVEFKIFNRLYIESMLENVFEKDNKHIQFNPIIDTFSLLTRFELSDNIDLYASHFCRHFVISFKYRENYLQNQLNQTIGQSQTRIGILLKS